MAVVFRNIKTNRLVKLYLRSPAMFTGSWIEEEDVQTKEIKKVSEGVKASRGSDEVNVDEKFYVPVYNC